MWPSPTVASTDSTCLPRPRRARPRRPCREGKWARAYTALNTTPVPLAKFDKVKPYYPVPIPIPFGFTKAKGNGRGRRGRVITPSNQQGVVHAMNHRMMVCEKGHCVDTDRRARTTRGLRTSERSEFGGQAQGYTTELAVAESHPRPVLILVGTPWPCVL